LNIVQEVISEFEYIAIRNYPNKAWNKKKKKKTSCWAPATQEADIRRIAV
jgi:hypothetical protein